MNKIITLYDSLFHNTPYDCQNVSNKIGYTQFLSSLEANANFRMWMLGNSVVHAIRIRK
jgi:hypothetical protein